MACGLKVAHSKIVGSERKPQAVGLLHFGRERIAQLVQVFGARTNALRRVQAVIDAARVGGVFRQHHHPAHPGCAGRQWIPLRFLVGQRRQQPPVDSGDRLCCLELVAVLWKQGTDVLDKTRCMKWREPGDMSEVSILESIQLAACRHPLEKRIRVGDQLLIDRGAEKPDNRLVRADLQRIL